MSRTNWNHIDYNNDYQRKRNQEIAYESDVYDSYEQYIDVESLMKYELCNRDIRTSKMNSRKCCFKHGGEAFKTKGLR